MDIQNNQECFVQLWLRLERTRQLFNEQYRIFCIRNVLKAWFGREATDDFIWEVCNTASDDEVQICGYDILPEPTSNPLIHRALLQAIVLVKLCLNKHLVKLSVLNKAFSIAFPDCTPINTCKKKRTKERNYVRQNQEIIRTLYAGGTDQDQLQD